MKKNFRMSRVIPFALSAFLLTTMVSCGDDDDDNDRTTVTTPQQPEEDQQQGEFRAALTPENASISTANGTAVVKVQGDEFETEVEVDDARNTTHAQHIHAGTRCPTPADDTNGDGVVDATEAGAVYGAVLLALDNDLATSTPGTYPSGVDYNYRETASFAQILADLNLQTMNVEGRVVNIHGIPDSVNLPATAQGGKAAFPIACGVLTRVTAEDGGTTTGGTTTGGTTTGGTTTGGTTTGGTTTGGTTTGGTTTGGTTTGGTTTGGTTTGGITTGGTTGI